MNYVYSILKRSWTASNETSNSFAKHAFLLIAFGIGGVINLVMYFVLKFDAAALAFGLGIGIIIGFLAIFYPGYDYKDSVQKMPKPKAQGIAGIITLIALLIFLVPILVELNSK